jgi:hypothetical protein
VSSAPAAVQGEGRGGVQAEGDGERFEEDRLVSTRNLKANCFFLGNRWHGRPFPPNLVASKIGGAL